MMSFNGKTINVGDAVITTDTHYHEFRKAVVTKLTEKTVFVEMVGKVPSITSIHQKRSPSQIIIL
jgi:hypothetical protein